MRVLVLLYVYAWTFHVCASAAESSDNEGSRAKCSDQAGTCSKYGSSAHEGAIWPRNGLRPTFRVWYQNPEWLGHPILERTLHQAGWRHASRGEAENLLWPVRRPGDSYEGLNLTLRQYPQGSRIALCPGLNGLHDKIVLKQNIKTFEIAMAFNDNVSLPFLMPPTWRLNKPTAIKSIPLASSGWVMVRPSLVARGENTYVFRSNETDKIQELMQTKKFQNKTLNAVEYVMPHLVLGRKWDFRVHALLIGFDPMRIYIGGSELSFVRFALQNFTLDSRDPFVHSSNSVAARNSFTETLPFQRYNTTFRLSLTNFVKEHMDEEEWSKTWAQVERISLRAMLAVEPKMRKMGRATLIHCDQCFELLAFDYMLDHQGQLKLLEMQRWPDPGYTFEGEGAVKRKMFADVVCVATGLGCLRASEATSYTGRSGKDADDQISPDLRPQEIPFEKAADDIAALREEVSREFERSKYTGFERLWPPPPRLAEMVQELDNTEVWALTLYQRAMLENATFGMPSTPRRMGDEHGRIESWL